MMFMFDIPGRWRELVLRPEGVRRAQRPLLEGRSSAVGEDQKQTQYTRTSGPALHTLPLQRCAG